MNFNIHQSKRYDKKMFFSNNTLLSIIVILYVISLYNFLLIIEIAKKNLSKQRSLGFDWLEIGSRAPKFYIQGIQREIFQLDDYSQKGLLIVFIRPHCRTCDSIVPKLEKLTAFLRERSICILIVCMTDLANAKEFVKIFELSLNLAVATKSNNKIFNDYKVGATPFFCLINKKQRVEDVGYFWPEERENSWTINSIDSMEKIVSKQNHLVV